MGVGVYLGVGGACALAGIAVGRWELAIAALPLLLIGLGVAALAGAFRASGDDNALGVFFFTGVPTVVWVACVVVGVALRRALAHAPRDDSRAGT